MVIRKKKSYMLGEELIRNNLVTLEQIDQALEVQKQTGEFIGQILIRFGYISETVLVGTLADQFEVPLVDPEKLSIPRAILERVPPKVAQHYHVFPIKVVQNKLMLVMSEPPEFDLTQELSAVLGTDLQVALAERAKIDEAIRKHYGIGASIVERLTQTKKESQPEADGAASYAAEEMEASVGESSVRELVNQLLVDAQHKRASDIHIEPFPDHLSVRYRIDGILQEARVPEAIKQFHASIISRIKIMANLDIAERRLPQDGRIKIKIHNEELDLRISLLPTAFGESLVVRLLSPTRLLKLENVGLDAPYLAKLRDILTKPSGIILLTGPTGSGKTTTLYASLSELNDVGRKIITVEDPVEYQLGGIIQMQVHPKIGLTFAKGLRHMLRHDPDVMMVGEVRDAETAEIAIRSSLTGHLVFSTLHTNDAVGAIARLIDLGMQSYLVASSLECVIAQRLVRLLCNKCKQQSGDEFVATGCDDCNGTGYFGRTAITEFFVLDEEIRDLITRKNTTIELRDLAIKKGLRLLRDDGLAKAKAGLTTKKEVLRVT
jgi:type II secretory ATPase GspE/PulE/Tfp pilus assembly ATPase PilB-like protein